MNTMDPLNVQNMINNMKNIIDFDLSPIQKFYDDAHIFITGSTGLLGSVLLEKLLRSCPNISTVYLLLRTKKGKNMETRLDEMFNDVLFEALQSQFPEYRQKVVGVEGDCTWPEMGLSLQDAKMLTGEVNIIFHLAATVRFDEKLKTAVAINVRAPRDLLRLAYQMPQLKSFVHVSTLYSNCIQAVIDEKVYPAAMDFDKLILLAENVPENILDNITPQLIGKYPNTYTYTKQIAETILKTEGQGLPVGISRPSIVIPTYKEPIPGWINNVYNITGMAAGCGLGILRVLYVNPNVNLNVIPVDMYINSLIATAWEISSTFQTAKKENLVYQMPIYNYESSKDKPISIRNFVDQAIQYGRITPPSTIMWHPFVTYASNNITYPIYIFFLHTIPGIIIDTATLCMGKSPRMLKIYTKMTSFLMMFAYFTTRTWIIKSKNVHELQRKFSEKDEKLFFSDLKQLDWDTYFRTYFIGIRLYILKDPLESAPRAARRLKWLDRAHQAVKAALAMSILWILWLFYANL